MELNIKYSKMLDLLLHEMADVGKENLSKRKEFVFKKN